MNSDWQQEETAEGLSPLHLIEIWLVVVKRRWLIIAIAAASFLLAAVKTYLTTPQYTARGTLLIDRDEPNILSFEQVFQITPYWGDEFYLTQYQILQSRALADRVARRLNQGSLEGLAGGGTAGSIQGRIKVTPVKGTRLVNISISDPVPARAAEIVNAIFAAFIELNIETKYAATEQATDFLSQQITGLGKEIADMERKLQEYGAEKNIVTLSDKETTIIEKLGELNSALTEAQVQTARKRAYYEEIRNASPEYFPDTLSNPVIKAAREDYSRLSREYSRKSEIFGLGYPELQRLKTEMDAAKATLEEETNNLVKTALADYQAALKNEKGLEAVFNRQRGDAIQLNSNAIAYYSLKDEIANKKGLLDSLIKREGETAVSARLRGLQTSNIKVLDKAEVPGSPSSPNRGKDMILGLLVGLMLGLGLAFLLNYLDNSIKTSEDVERYARLPTLGVIPKLVIAVKPPHPESAAGEEGTAPAKTDSIELISHFSPRSNFAESYRAIRTSLLLSSPDAGRKAVIITSALASEGKTATLGNLAVTLCQMGRRILIVDADLRKPRQHKVFGIRNTSGLTNYLTEKMELKHLLKPTFVPNLFLINAGPIPPNPAELLGSEKMGTLIENLRENLDYILIDTPPILAVTDAIILAPKTDGVVLVVWGGKTSREAVKRSKERLDLTKTKTLGVVLNRINPREHSFYYNYHYYSYGNKEKS